MSLAPTLLIGLGKFPKKVSTDNYNTLLGDNIILESSKAFSLLTIDDSLISRYSNEDPKTIKDKLSFSNKNSYKDNFAYFLENKDIVNKTIQKSISKIHSLEAVDNNLHLFDTRKINVIIYFNLGDKISSVIVREVANIISKHELARKIEVYFICFNYDLDQFLIEDAELEKNKKRAYACLQELDHFINSKDGDRVISFSLFSRTFFNQAAYLTSKDDLVPAVLNFVKKVIKNDLGSFSSPEHRKKRVAYKNKKIIYNTFGHAKLRFDKERLWRRICDFKLIENLTSIYDNIQQADIVRTNITTLVNRFILGGQDIKAHLLKLEKQLSQNDDAMFFVDFLSFSQTQSNNNPTDNLLVSNTLIDEQDEQADMNKVEAFISSLTNTDQKYFANQWQITQQKIGDNFKSVTDRFIANLEEETLDKFNNEYNIVGFREGLKKLLGYEKHDMLDGDRYDQEFSLEDLLYQQLMKFKQWYMLIPEEQRDLKLKQIIDSNELKDLRNEIINLKSEIVETKSRILELDKYHLNSKISFETSIKDGYFTINGNKLDINGCLRSDVQEESDSFTSILTKDEIKLSVDLRQYFPKEIDNQGDIKSCVTNAITIALEYLARRITGNKIDMSRMFLYYAVRDLELSDDIEDIGCTMFNALKTAESLGICLETTWPYEYDKTNVKPTSFAYIEAEQYKLDTYQRIEPNINDMIACLSEGYPFVFALKIFNSFHSNHNGLIPPPILGEEVSSTHGNHAMTCVGYNKEKQYFIVRNSWGVEWGDQGYCYIPFSYMTDSNMIFDIFTLRSVDETINEKIRKNVFEADSTIFDAGLDRKQQAEAKSKTLTGLESIILEKESQFNSLNKKFLYQNEYFNSQHNRQEMKDKIEEQISVDISEQKQKIIDKQKDVGFAKKQLKEKLKAQDRFFKLHLLAPFVVWLILALSTGFIFGWQNSLDFILELPRYLINTVTYNPDVILEFKLIRFILGSFTLIGFIGWFLYSVYKWIVSYYFPIKNLKRAFNHRISEMSQLQQSLLNSFSDKWSHKFSFSVNSYLLEQVLSSTQKALSDKLDKLESFITSIKTFRENISRNYKEVDIRQSSFVKDILSIPDIKNIDVFLEEFKVNNKDNSFDITFNNNLLPYFNEFYKNGLSSFESEITSHWESVYMSYINMFPLSKLVQDNILNTRDKIRENIDWLERFSTPLTDIYRGEPKFNQKIDLYCSDESDWMLYYEQCSDVFPQKIWNNVNRRTTDDSNYFSIFYSITAFPAFCIKAFRGMKNDDDYFIYEGTPPLEPNNN